MYVSIRNGPLSKNQFQAISHKANLMRSFDGVKE